MQVDDSSEQTMQLEVLLEEASSERKGEEGSMQTEQLSSTVRGVWPDAS